MLSRVWSEATESTNSGVPCWGGPRALLPWKPWSVSPGALKHGEAARPTDMPCCPAAAGMAAIRVSALAFSCTRLARRDF